MTRTIEAVYERGVLRLKEPVALADGTIVEVTITTSEPSGENKTPADILSAIASLPIEGDGSEFSGRDHDKVLRREEYAMIFVDTGAWFASVVPPRMLRIDR